MKLSHRIVSLSLVAAAWASSAPAQVSVTHGEHFTPNLDPRGIPLDPRVVQAVIQQAGYSLEPISSDGIEQLMPIGRTAENGIPEAAQGIWWISFNPFGGEILTTFGGPASRYDSATRTVYQDNFGPGAYSYEADSVGNEAFFNVLVNKMVFAIQFSEDFKHADLRLSVEILGHRVEIPEALLKYTMDLVEDGHFARHSWFFGQRVTDYQLLRVVRADGQRDPAYADYLKAAPKDSILARKVQ